MDMRSIGKGGMQTGGANYSIYCPKCGKPAARKEPTENGVKYMHFTKNGSIWHEYKAITDDKRGA